MPEALAKCLMILLLKQSKWRQDVAPESKKSEISDQDVTNRPAQLRAHQHMALLLR